MHHTMDVTEVDKGPIRNYSVENALFYITFVIVFVFFFLNVFVALVVLTFQEQKEKQLVKSKLDRNQVVMKYAILAMLHTHARISFTLQYLNPMICL